MAKVKINLDEDLFLEPYRPLLASDYDINFLWGGRDGGKSQFVAQKLLLDCLQLKYFRCLLVKKTYESIKDSQWQTLKDIAEEWGIDQYFTFGEAPLKIVCRLNGNTFICRGLDKPGKLKSIKDPSHAWYEEGNQMTEQDYITISTTLRSDKARIQEWFTFNPEVEDDLDEFWLYRNYFKIHVDKGEYNFEDTITTTLPTGEKVTLRYVSVHTTYHDNPYCTPDRKARHEALQRTNPYYYQVFTLGLFGKRQTGGEFYKCYKPDKHVIRVRSIKGFDKGFTDQRPYNPELPLHLTLDFNVNPYMAASVWQGIDKTVYKIAEIILPHPRNTSLAVAAEFSRLFASHTAGLNLYGDPGGLKQSTADDTLVRVKEQDYSEFNKIKKALSKFHPSMRVPRNYPAVRSRGDFINNILELGFEGCQIFFDQDCKRTQAEYSNLKEKSDGTKFKEMYKDEDTGVQCQKWGHISDGDDYFLTQYFAEAFRLFQHGGKGFDSATFGGRDFGTSEWSGGTVRGDY